MRSFLWPGQAPGGVGPSLQHAGAPACDAPEVTPSGRISCGARPHALLQGKTDSSTHHRSPRRPGPCAADRVARDRHRSSVTRARAQGPSARTPGGREELGCTQRRDGGMARSQRQGEGKEQGFSGWAPRGDGDRKRGLAKLAVVSRATRVSSRSRPTSRRQGQGARTELTLHPPLSRRRQLGATVAPRRPAPRRRVRLPSGPGAEPGAPGCSAPASEECVSITQPHCADENPLEVSPRSLTGCLRPCESPQPNAMLMNHRRSKSTL